MTPHTPGPWTYDEAALSRPGALGPAARSSEGRSWDDRRTGRSL